MNEITAKTQEIIICPQCQGFLKYGENVLFCSACQINYLVIGGIPQIIDPEIISQTISQNPDKKRKQLEIETFDDAAAYEELESRPYFLALKNKIRLVLKNYQWQNKIILEIGAGISEFADLFGSDNDLILNDLNAKLLAKNASPCQKIAADAEALPFCNQAFDFIYVVGMLHHLPNQEQALRELQRVIKPGGKIFIAEPVRWSLNYPYFLGRKIILKTLGAKKLKQLTGCVSPEETFVQMKNFKKIFKNCQIKKSFVLPCRLPPFKKLERQKWIVPFNNFLEKIPLINKLGTIIFIEINYEPRG